MYIFSKQATVFQSIKAVLIAASSLTQYNKFWQDSGEIGEYLPALAFYIRSDQPTSNEEMTDTGKHTRIMSFVCRIYLDASWNESIETISDNVYTAIFNWADSSSATIYNPSLTYQFDESNNYRVADLEVPILYMV